jgi:4-carboxymuconolactone decarboxylase
MSAKPASTPSPFADIAPALVDHTDRVLFDDAWRRPGLSLHDRRLITVAVLSALSRPTELPANLTKAPDNGFTRAELTELITHFTFHSGWPTTNTAVAISGDGLRTVYLRATICPGSVAATASCGCGHSQATRVPPWLPEPTDKRAPIMPAR